MLKGDNWHTSSFEKKVCFFLDTIKARFFKLCLLITLLGIYVVILGVVTLSVFQGHRCVRNIICKLRVLDSCPLATKTLVTSLVLSRLDYCNSLFSGIPQQLIDKLQKVQNYSARLIFKTSWRTHFSPLLAKLHWLPIAQRIEYKMSFFCYDVASDTALLYLSPSPICPFPLTAFIFWHPHLSNTNTKEKVPGTACFLPSRPCHLE